VVIACVTRPPVVVLRIPANAYGLAGHAHPAAAKQWNPPCEFIYELMEHNVKEIEKVGKKRKQYVNVETGLPISGPHVVLLFAFTNNTPAEGSSLPAFQNEFFFFSMTWPQYFEEGNTREPTHQLSLTP
jgi:hypothetical protein